jgi:regulator of sigma E protease
LNEEKTAREYVEFKTTLDESILKSFRVPFSEQNGLKINDTIIKVNSAHVHTYNELYYEISFQGCKELDLTVLRDGKELVLEDVAFLVQTEGGVELGYVDIIPYREQNFDFFSVMKHTWFRSLSTVKTVFDSLVALFTGRVGIEAMSGPIGITKVVSDAAQVGFTSVLYLVVIISINLGVMNLLPIPALDGSHILIYLIELIRRKPMKKELEAVFNLVGLVLILFLAVFIAIKDIITLL